jgi:hypothetical protein
MSVNLGIPQSPPNTPDTYLYARLVEIYNALNNLANSQMSNSILQFANITLTCRASESILANSFVNIQPNGLVRNATAVTGRALPVDGSGASVFASPGLSTDRSCNAFSTSAIPLGSAGVVILAPCTLQVSGLVTGSKYYLSANTVGSQGTIYGAPDAGAGNGYLHQYVGLALTSKTLYFNPELNPLQW